jgi:hypothetical protein
MYLEANEVCVRTYAALNLIAMAGLALWFKPILIIPVIALACLTHVVISWGFRQPHSTEKE